MTFFRLFESRAKARTRVRNQRIMNPYIGVLISATDTTNQAGGTGAWDPYIAAFKSALVTNIPPAQWYEEPSTRSGIGSGAGGDQAGYGTAAGNLVGYNPSPSVIVTGGTLAASECQKYTTTIPIVVASAGDLSSLTGSNFTGCTNGQANTLISDARIARMNNKLKPTAVGVAGNWDVQPVQNAMNYAYTQLLKQLGPNKAFLVYLRNNGTDLPDLPKTLTNLQKQNGVNVLYVCSDPFVRTNGTTIVKAAKALGMKTMHEFGEWVGPGPHNHGGDLSFGPDFTKLFQRAAGYVDQILNGASPANLPIFEPQVADCVQTPP